MNRTASTRRWFTLSVLAGVAACGDPRLAGDFSAEALEEEALDVLQESQEQAALEAVESACAVTVAQNRELIIRDLAVVNDTVRTRWTGSLSDPSDGAWHFGRLMAHMAGSKNPSTFTRSLFEKWLTNQVVNGETVPPRTAVQLTLNSWPKRADGSLDLTQAPLRLLAIVNRMDLRKLSQGNAGEGRFVFGLLDEAGNPLQFTIILEYKLPARTRDDVMRWANAWHALGSLDPATSSYRAALQAVTDQFTRKDAAPGRPNGSAIGQIRTNDFVFADPWELREFGLNDAGNIVQRTVLKTPRGSHNGTSVLRDYINNNEAAILANTHQVPLTLSTPSGNVRFRGGASANFLDSWNAEGIRSATARHRFSLNTCNGCHGAETGTGFLHVLPRVANQRAGLSGFMTGIDVPDPMTGTVRHFDDLKRRATNLKSLLCSSSVNSVLESTSDPVH